MEAAKGRNGGAHYLLRLDDLCPTANRERWEAVRAMVDSAGVAPILAVVPRNEDPDLICSPPDPEFWARVRSWEAQGATVALHGYRHAPRSRGKALLPLHRATEFAGVPVDEQRAWIQSGLRELRAQKLAPKLWIAPRHGFDRATLQALRESALPVLSDGWTARPYRRDGVLCLPQQLWEPAEKNAGLWTICMHPSTAGEEPMQRLHRFLSLHAGAFLTFEQAVARYPATEYGCSQRLAEGIVLWRKRISQLRSRLRKL